jgi:hypothetical protein
VFVCARYCWALHARFKYTFSLSLLRISTLKTSFVFIIPHIPFTLFMIFLYVCQPILSHLFCVLAHTFFGIFLVYFTHSLASSWYLELTECEKRSEESVWVHKKKLEADLHEYKKRSEIGSPLRYEVFIITDPIHSPCFYLYRFVFFYFGGERF